MRATESNEPGGACGSNATTLKTPMLKAAINDTARAAARSARTADDAPREERAQIAAVPGPPYELSVVIPTFNERENVRPLIETLSRSLQGIAWEAIFVDDDSPDGTAGLLRSLANAYPNMRCIQRIGRRGLASACIEGMLASSSPYLAVMDADLQHDVGILPLMLHTLKRDQLEIVVGSRYVEGGGTGDLDQSRVQLSHIATRIAKLATHASLKDPMSGFFLLRRPLLDRTIRRMSGKGFKILLDLFMSADAPVRFGEIPYKMRSRARGQSKLDQLVAWEFGMLLADKLIGRFIPIRFIMFVAVGTAGALMHLAVLGFITQLLHYPFVIGQAVATITAMTVNFFLNNVLTYRDRQLRGWRIVWGLTSFYVACGLGALINIVLAQFLFQNGIIWWLSGLLGALVGAVWNFAVTSSFTWTSDVRRVPTAAPTAATKPDESI